MVNDPPTNWQRPKKPHNRPIDRPWRANTTPSPFNMTSLAHSLPTNEKGKQKEKPNIPIVRISEEPDVDNDEEEENPLKPSRRKARDSIQGINDIGTATQRLARQMDNSIDHLYSQVNLIQDSNIEYFQKMEQQLLKNVQQAVKEAVKSSLPASPADSVATAFRTPKPNIYAPSSQRQQHLRAPAQEFKELDLLHENEEEEEDEDEEPHKRGKRSGRPYTALASEKPLPPDEPITSRVYKSDFKAHEVGYFYPGLTITKDYPEGPYITTGKDTYYRDVHMFIQQAKRVGRTKPDVVAANLHLCLRGSAMTWFSCLKPSRQDSLSDDLSLFCTTLVEKYKQSHSQAFDKIHSERYTMVDAQRLRPADEFVQTMLLHGQSCDQSTTAVLTLAWKNLDKELQRDVRRPTHGDPDEFARDLDDAAEYWASNSMPINTSIVKPAQQQIIYNPGSRRDAVDEKEAAFQRGVRSAERRLLPQPQLPLNPTQPQNRGYQQQSQQAQNRGAYPPAPPPRFGPQRQIAAHQAAIDEENNVEQNNEEIDHGNSDEYANFGSIAESYQTNDHVWFNESDSYLHGVPPHSCNICYQGFTNYTDVDVHMMELHGIDTQSSTQKAQRIYANWLEHAALHVVIIRPPPENRGYATVQSRLYSEDGLHQDCCIDTGSSATFIDESLLPKENLFDRLHKTPPITVRGISGERVVDKKMMVSIFLTGTDGTILRIDASAYVTKGIKAGIILGMDELGRPEDDIALWLGRKMMQMKGTHIPINFTARGSKPVTF